MSTVREEAVVSLGLDTTKIRHDMTKFGSDFRSSIANVSKQWLGALSAGGIIAGINTLLNKFDDLNDKAENLDISTDFLQGMAHLAGKDVVGGVKTFDKAIGELSVKLGEAKSGSAEAIKTFEKWGITLAAIKDKNTEEVFYILADAIKAIPDPATRSAAAFDLLGKAGKNMSGFLAQGSEDVGKMVAAVQKLDVEKVRELARAKDELNDASNSVSIFTAKIVTAYSAVARFVGKWSPMFQAHNRANGGLENFLTAESGQRLADAEKRFKDHKPTTPYDRLKEVVTDLGIRREKESDFLTWYIGAAKQAADAIHDYEKRRDEQKEQRQRDDLRRGDLHAQLYKARHAEFQPALDELADTDNPYNREAWQLRQNMQWAKFDTLHGNKEALAGDLSRIQDLRDKLSAAGVYSDPNKGIIDEIAKLNRAENGPGLKVDIKMK